MKRDSQVRSEAAPSRISRFWITTFDEHLSLQSYTLADVFRSCHGIQEVDQGEALY